KLMISILFFLLGLLSSVQVIGYAVVAESNSLRHASSAMGLAAVIIMAGCMFSQPLYGKLLELGWAGQKMNDAPLYNADNFFHATLILPIAFMIAILVACVIKETFNQYIKSDKS
ncbi:MAG: hypothetical protein ACK4PR_11035, partial [Gammaproteobacteria bacterium]